jgi:hypothetical protein
LTLVSDSDVKANVSHEIVLLTTCSVAPDGGRVTLGFRDQRGDDTALIVSVEKAGALLMTLPGLIERALRLRHRDASLRYVFPLGDWTLEAAGGEGRTILNLTTADGFAVSFAVAGAQARDLATALDESKNFRPSMGKRQ